METNIQKYMAFVETVRLGSFTEAAEKLNYSQSGISRMIADLEHDWNLTLLERGRFGIRITSDGLKILPFAKRLCSEFEKIQSQVSDLKGLEKGLIRIGTVSSVATHWLPKIIKEFQKDYPGIDYEILLGDYLEIEEWIEEGRVDCGFLILPVKEEFYSINLKKDQLMAIIPQNHPLAYNKTYPVSRLEKDSFMLLDKGGKNEISGIFSENNITPNVRFTTLDDYAIMSMVENGLGVSILPELILKRIPYNILIKPLDKPAFRDIGFVLRDFDTASIAVKRFMEYLKYRD
ncbi:DNA-binding transcriptional regulator, LysR family [Acetitomaculum ruminis DSM 5522]|uniref:DNA-binding transcriptional regulator, LysR family n=1 Tax=Acetitomaculum ruminis DSM 5522 TaxID=1120918 RepID=A0A1I0ZWR9_9FIRM|nr:LysR family transcriptional regulator [Acetitomaculum ruminis]SFB30179.1 DNA-binding transcriptional regulator, LysR family [Acetitomaculum ruminis DSM 5522]